MKIEQYIGELLYHHDCVIVPDFGGFVTNYKSAYLHPATHTFSPPCKRIAFNSLLKNNDGLLANYITRQTALNYNEACEQIGDFVAFCNKRLNKGKKLNLDNIGVLSFDQEKNLQFVPDTDTNYLLDSFGLTLVHSPAIRRDGTRAVTSDFNRSVLTEKVKRFRIKTKHVVYFSSAAVLAAVLFFSPVIISKLNLSNLNPFENTAEIKTTVPETESATPVVSKKEKEVVNILPDQPASAPAESTTPVITTDSSVAQPGSENNSSVAEKINILPDKKITAPVIREVIQPTENSPEPLADAVKPVIKEKEISKTENKLSVPVSPSDAVTNETARYFIIVGAFRVYDNAVNFVTDLKSKGYDAAIVGLNPKGLHMVSAAAAANVYKATESLDSIHSKEFKDAWLYRKR